MTAAGTPNQLIQAQVPNPRTAVIRRGRDAGDAARFWTAVFYLAEGALLLGRTDEAITALAQAVQP